MDFQRYFQNELVALRALGNEAAERNPSLTPFFSTPGGDSAVECLLEGFSFLAGRLREKLDDELPEITQGLFSLLWPNYLRPFPATSIIQYRPTENVTGSTSIPKGTLVQSVPVEGTPCTFQTVYDTEILPLRLSEQRFLERNGIPILAVRFSLTSGTLHSLPLTSLRFFFTGSEVAAHTLYFTLLRHVDEIRFVLGGAGQEEHISAVLEPSALRPVGIQGHEGLYPYAEHVSLGYRILQEYFSYPEKFLFVEVSGLEKGINEGALRNFPQVEDFELHFVLREIPENYEELQTDNWKLFCTPVVNLFPFKSAPLRITGGRQEYKITPEPHTPGHFSVYSVERVSTWSESEKKDLEYENAVSFTGQASQERMSPRYRLHVKPPWSGEEIETFIAVDSGVHEEVVLDLDLTCTNNQLPRQLQVGDINASTDKGNMSAVPFINILPVVAPMPPPLRGDVLWKLLSNMSLNNIPLHDIASLRAVLASQHFRAMHEHHCARDLERTMRGIVSIQSTEGDRIFGGRPVRGMRTYVTLDPSCFCCQGDLYLFGVILNEFFSLYATQGSFQQLIIVSSQGEEYQWPARLGGFTRR